MANNLRNKRFGKKRRAVAGVIAGVFFMAIMLSTVAVYFVLNLTNERTRASYEIQSQQENQAKTAEKLTVVRDEALDCTPGPDCFITVYSTDEGATPLVITNVLLYCTDTACPPIPVPPGTDPNDPVEQLPGGAPLTLNAKEQNQRTVGPVNGNLTYRVDVITERGNVVSAVECLVDAVAQICIDAGGSTGPDFELSASPPGHTMTPGGTPRTSEIRVYSQNGFSAPVDIVVTGPPDITATPTPNTITPPDPGFAAYDLTITALPTLAEGTYILTVTGTSGALTHSVSITISTFSVTGAVNEGIVQGTGSLQLDFRAFGAILPQLGDRDGVNQKGWNVVTASRYGAATGYPAFEIPYQAHVFFVERMRNLDPGGEDITLTRKTALITNQGTIPPGQQSIVYICKENPSATDGVEAYREQTAFKFIANTPINAAPTVGWVEVYFCQENPGADYNRGNDSCGGNPSASNGYCPEHTNEQLNGIIMVARGTFTPSLSQYGQTIPYQSAQPGLVAFTDFNWCLYEPPGTNVACPDPKTSSASSNLIYTANQATMQGGLDIFAHYRDTSSALPNPGATITWIYPDGTGVVLADNQNLVNQAIPISLPTTNSDGTTPIDCDGQSSEDYIIKINDSFSSEGTRNVYYMTFRVTCP